jgi:hypothetical protein
MSIEPRDDSLGQAPGSARSDEEERLFVATLSEEDQRFYEEHRGLGNSQKAEVAWLEQMGYDFEEVDVRDCDSRGWVHCGDGLPAVCPVPGA